MRLENAVRRLRAAGWEPIGGNVYMAGAWELDIKDGVVFVYHVTKDGIEEGSFNLDALKENDLLQGYITGCIVK